MVTAFWLRLNHGLLEAGGGHRGHKELSLNFSSKICAGMDNIYARNETEHSSGEPNRPERAPAHLLAE